MPSADAASSRRTIRLRKRERTNQGALGDQRKRVKRGEKNENGGKWETGSRGGKGVLAAQIKKSVVGIGRTEEVGQGEQTRPEKSPSSTTWYNKDGPSSAEERKRRCCACGSLVRKL